MSYKQYLESNVKRRHEWNLSQIVHVEFYSTDGYDINQ